MPTYMYTTVGKSQVHPAPTTLGNSASPKVSTYGPKPPSAGTNDSHAPVYPGTPSARGRHYCGRNTLKTSDSVWNSCAVEDDESTTCGPTAGRRCLSCCKFHNGELKINGQWVPPSNAVIGPNASDYTSTRDIEKIPLLYCAKCNLYVDPVPAHSPGFLTCMLNIMTCPFQFVFCDVAQECPQCEQELDKQYTNFQCCPWGIFCLYIDD